MLSDYNVLIGKHTVIQRPENNELIVKGEDDRETLVRLNSREFTLFRILNDSRGLGVEREYLIDKIRDGEEGSDELLERTKAGLVTKLQKAGIREDFIETAPGKKYRLIFNQHVEDPANTDSLRKGNISRKVLWALLIILILAALLVIADIVFPDEEEVPEPNTEIGL